MNENGKNTLIGKILFDESVPPTETQGNFLSNGRNKYRLIKMLKGQFRNQNYEVRQAAEDADSLIFRTGIEVAENYNLGEGVDSLVLYTALWRNPKIYFLKPGKGKNISEIILSFN